MCRLKEHSTLAGSRAVVLSPTRELALQTAKVVKELAKYTDLRIAILVGGDSMEAQFAELAANPDIIVATPGGRTIHLNLHISGTSSQSVHSQATSNAHLLRESKVLLREHRDVSLKALKNAIHRIGNESFQRHCNIARMKRCQGQLMSGS